MKKNVLYSLAALSALPMGASATVINVPANKSVSAAVGAMGEVDGDMVFTPADGNKVVIEVAKKGGLYPGKYLLKAVISNGESANQLTVKYSVNDGDFVTSSVDALAAGVEVNVSSILKSRIVLTVEDENAQKALFTVGGISLDLQFDFNAVYNRLNSIYNTYLSAEEPNGQIHGFSHFANVTASGQSQTNGERLSDIKDAAEDWADDTEDANYSQENQNYETYVAQKLYGLFNNDNGSYSEDDDDWNKLDLVKSYKTAAKQLLADIKDAENKGRSAAALEGYTSLWEALKEEYRKVQEVVGNTTITKEYGDKGVEKDGTLRQKIKGIADEAYGKGELVSTMDDLRTKVKNMKAEIDALDQAFTNSIDSDSEDPDPLQTVVQDYSNLSFVESTAQYEALDADVTKVKDNYSGYTDDQAAYTTLSGKVTALEDEVSDLTAGVDVSIANKQEIDKDLEAIQTALATYNTEMGEMHESYSYYSGTVNPQKHAKTIDKIEALITALKGKIATKTAEYVSISEADKGAVSAVDTKTGTLSEELEGANTAIGKIAEIKDGEELIYKASNYADVDAIEAAIEKISTDARAVEHATDYVAENNAANLPKSKFMYVYDEATYNEAWNKGYFEAYYDAYPTEDVDNEDVERGHSFDAALQSAKTSNKHTWPWVVIGFDNYTGKVEFKYNDVKVFEWAVKDKVYGMVSVPLDMELSEFSGWDDNGNYDSKKPATFDPSKLTITLLGTDKQVVEDYDHAVNRIRKDIADYQTQAETVQEAFATEWGKYTTLAKQFNEVLAEVSGEGYDYTDEKAGIQEEIKALKATLTTAASTSIKGDAHKAAVENIDIDDTVARIKADIEEVKYMVDAAKTAAEQLRLRNEARAALDLILGTFNIQDLKNAFGSDDAQGIIMDGSENVGSQVGGRLKDEYTKWLRIYTELYEIYEAASGKDAAAAAAAYNELKEKVGDDNDFTDVQTALLTTVFEGYEGSEEGQKGLIYALAQHKNGVAANVKAKEDAYNALGYNENGVYDETIPKSLANTLKQKKTDAVAAVNAGVDFATAQDTEEKKYITEADKTKAIGENGAKGLIDTRKEVIEEKISALKVKVDNAYGEEKLGTFWSEDHKNAENKDEEAFSKQVETLKTLAGDLLTRTEEWINATDLHNRQTANKAAATQAKEDALAALENLDLGTAKDHYDNAVKEEYGKADKVAILEVDDKIITENTPWIDTDGAEAAKVKEIDRYKKNIDDQDDLATTNKTVYESLYSGQGSKYATVEGELSALGTFINQQEETPARDALQEAYNGENNDDALVKQLAAAETTIKENYKNGAYEEGTEVKPYTDDAGKLDKISEQITQVQTEFNENYNADIVAQNKVLKAAMDAKLAGCQNLVRYAQGVLEKYKKLTLDLAELTAVKDYQLSSINSMLTISSSIEQNVNTCNAQNKLYQGTNELYVEDNGKIQAIYDNIDEFIVKVQECNDAISSAWETLAQANTLDADKEAIYGAENAEDDTNKPFANLDNSTVDPIVDMAEELLNNGNTANSTLNTKKAGIDFDKDVLNQQTKVDEYVDAAVSLVSSINAYINAETGYAPTIANAKNKAAETDIKAKAKDWRTDNVTPVREDLNAEKPSFTKVEGEQQVDLLKDLDLTKTEEYNNDTKTRKEILLEMFDEAIGTNTENSIGKLEKAIEETAENAFFNDYEMLKTQYAALTLTTTDLENKIQAWKAADELYADIQAKVDEYVKLTNENKLDESIDYEDEDAPILNKQYLTEKALISGSLVENDEDVVAAYRNLKRAIEIFGTTTYVTVNAVKTVYEDKDEVWKAAMTTAVSKEKTAISDGKAGLNTLFNGDYADFETDFQQQASVQSRINAIDATSDDFKTLKGYEQEIVDLNVLMLNVINTGGADVYKDLKQKAAGLEISSQDVKDFLGYEFGTDTHATDVKAKQTELAAEKEAIVAAINELNADFNGDQPKYTADNILYYKDDVVGIIGDENGGLVKRIAALTEAVTEIGSVDGMTPAEALADYKARKTANETAKSEIESAITVVEGELEAAVKEYPEIANDIVIAFNSLTTDYNNLDLVEKVNGEYQTKSTYDTTDLSNDIKSALYSARKTELTDYITEEKLSTIVDRVNTAITNKGLIGLAKKNLQEQAYTYNTTFTNEYAKITDKLTKEAKEDIRQALEDLDGLVDALIENVKSYKQPGDITGTGGEVDALDFQLLKNIILGKITTEEAEVDLVSCDLNGDGKVGIGDLVILNNLVLGLNPNGTEPGARALNGGESLTTETTVTGENTRRIAISLDNSREYVAFQIDMVLPEGMTLVGESLTDRARLQRLASNDLADGTHRIISVPVLNTTFKGNDGAMLYIDVETSPSYMGGDVELKSVVFTDALGQETEFGIASETTGIMDTLKSAAQTAKEAIYSVGGKMRDGLKKGINIIRRADGSTEKVIKK